MFELKKRKRADSCDAHGCRIKEGLTIIGVIPGFSKQPFKLCGEHWDVLNDADLDEADLAKAMADDSDPVPTDAHSAQVRATVGMLYGGGGDKTAVLDDKSAALVKLDGMLEQAETELTQLSAIEISNQAGLEACGAMLKGVKGRTKEVEALRVEEKKPFLVASKEIDGRFKPARDALLALEKLLKKAMAAYSDDQEKRRVMLMEQGRHEDAIATQAAVMPAGISTTTTWQFEVTDADAIPREFMVPDAARIQAHVSAHKNNSSIPGIKVFPKTGVRSGSS